VSIDGGENLRSSSRQRMEILVIVDGGSEHRNDLTNNVAH
jgi:hypothetical protein